MPKTLIDRLDALTARTRWVGPLLARISLGAVFTTTGWGKLHSLGKVTEFFQSLGLPAAHFQAALVGTTEFLGGLALLLGLGTRLASVALGFTMVVAILTAKRAEIDGLGTLLGFEEFTYLVVFIWLALGGAGAVSLDAVLKRWSAEGPRVTLQPHGRGG